MRTVFICFLLVCFGACHKKPNYAEFERLKPRSILVLPPLNTTVALDASNSYLSTISQPVAERGYYVFPVAVVERMLRENGVTGPEEMRQVPRDKLVEIFGADALLDITIDDWSTSYFLLQASTTVKLTFTLFDLASGTELWTGTRDATLSSGGGGGGGLAALVESVVSAAVHAASSTDDTAKISLASQINQKLLGEDGYGLLKGPRWIDPEKRS